MVLGLGTSSILIYSCLKAILLFCKKSYIETDLYHLTVCAEQIMTTYGGYQDAIGACGKGFKLTHFKPGLIPEINCKTININPNIQKNIQDRILFIYTGQTRVAKNLVNSVVTDYINKKSTTISTLKTIGITAKHMADDLYNNDLPSFSHNMIKSFNLNTILNSDFSNPNINSILHLFSNFIDGYMLSGAGGGGFITFFLKENISKKNAENLLKVNFPNSNIKIYNFKIIF